MVVYGNYCTPPPPYVISGKSQTPSGFVMNTNNFTLCQIAIPVNVKPLFFFL